jgi:5'-3' exonuclease
MGITGLLPALAPFIKKQKLNAVMEHVGNRAAVDMSDWLYKAACRCPWDLFCGNMNAAKKEYMKYLRCFLRKLRNAGVYPHIVFDGSALPAVCDQQYVRVASPSLLIRLNFIH